jgi:membrane-bound ClpP family serine protease
MKLSLLIAILAAATGVAAALMIALYVHKRQGAGDIRLIGEIAQVDTKLDPEGTVLVCGELWRAKSTSEAVISTGAQVRVIAFVDHLALVELCD